MRQAIAIVLLACSAAALRAQEAGGAGAQGDAADPGGMKAPADPSGMKAHHAELAAEWETVQGHWAMVQSLPADQKPEHLEMHRTMLGDLMDELDAHGSAMREREGEGPTVGDRMEGADREPVPGERPGEETEEAAAEATTEGKEGERLDGARLEDEERRAAHEAMKASVEEVRAHWMMVEGIQDPEQLETHLGMHMDLLAGLHEQMEKRHGGAEEHGEGGMKPGHEGMHHDAEEGGDAAPEPRERPAGY